MQDQKDKLLEMRQETEAESAAASLKIKGFIGHDSDRLLKDREAAKVYGGSRSWFWAMVKSGGIPPPIKIGSVTRWSNNILQADIQRRLAEQRGEVE